MYYNNVKDVIHIIISGFHVELKKYKCFFFIIMSLCKKKFEKDELFIIF